MFLPAIAHRCPVHKTGDRGVGLGGVVFFLVDGH